MQHTTLPCSDATRRARDGEQLFCAQFLFFSLENGPITRWRKSVLFGTLTLGIRLSDESQLVLRLVGFVGSEPEQRQARNNG